VTATGTGTWQPLRLGDTHDSDTLLNETPFFLTPTHEALITLLFILLLLRLEHKLLLSLIDMLSPLPLWHWHRTGQTSFDSKHSEEQRENWNGNEKSRDD
jgi:hypothetical protein